MALGGRTPKDLIRTGADSASVDMVFEPSVSVLKKLEEMGVDDEDGFIYIKGRCKTMLLGPSGQNIYPEEIEAKINNMPYVLESLVLQKDTRLVALVCPDFEAVDADKLSQEQLEVVMEENRKLVNAELAAYEQINELRIYTHEFEKTPKKSIKRFLYEA